MFLRYFDDAATENISMICYYGKLSAKKASNNELYSFLTGNTVPYDSERISNKRAFYINKSALLFLLLP